MSNQSFDLHAERVFDAPPDVLFDAYTAPELWRSLGATSECELRVGGIWTIVGADPGAAAYRETNQFARIDRPRQISFTSTLALPDGAVLVREVEANFRRQDGKTRMTIDQRGFPSREARDALEPAFPNIFNSLERIVESRVGPRQD